MIFIHGRQLLSLGNYGEQSADVISECHISTYHI